MPDPSSTVYANALYAAAEDSDRTQQVGSDLGELVRTLGESPDLVEVLGNPAVSSEAKGRVLEQLTAGGEALLTRALTILLRNGRLGLLADVEEAYAARFAAEHGELDVVLTTAIAISEEQTEGLRAKLAAATGKTVSLERAIDPAILGGVVLRVRDLIIDASVHRRLELLRLNLKSSRPI